MKLSSFRRCAAWILGGVATISAALAAETGSASVPAQKLCDALIVTMKKGPAMDFAAREQFLGPVVEQSFDLPLMTRIVVGPPWRSMSETDRAGLLAAFREISIASYAQEFKSYGGEHFEVDPAAVALPNGAWVVHTKLFTGNQTVELDYVERQEPAGWKIIDVLLNGSISQLAERRSEYSATLRQGGAPALIALLRQKAAELAH